VTPPKPRNPWWIPIWLGRAPALSVDQRRMLGLVVLGTFFESYDLSLLSSAVKHIAEDLAIGADRLPFVLAAVRFGGFFAFALLPLADRLGRRRVFLGAILGMSAGTLATAFAQSPAQFVAFQVFARAFMIVAASVGIVMMAEELPAEHRGWGIGMLGALGAFGHGLGALLFALVDVLPFGWRALYAVGAIPVIALPAMGRSLRETTRFEAHRARLDADPAATGWLAWIRPLAALARNEPRRALCVGLAGFSLALGGISVFQFASYFLQTAHGWAPWQYSTMLFVGGGIGIVGNVVAGHLGDRFGRRIVGFVALALYPVAAIAFYQGPEWALGACFALIVFTSNAGDVVIRAFSTELFPTSQRGSSAGWLTLLSTMGFITGLSFVGSGTESDADLPLWISLGSLSVLLAAVCVLLLPESRGRELETLSHEIS
jgi:putative MFS transporter